MDQIKYIDEIELKDKKVFLRVDFNVSLTKDSLISDDLRIRQTIPTIRFLLKNNNKLIIGSHLGKPKNREERYSLLIVCERLKEYLSEAKITFIKDFETDEGKKMLLEQSANEIILLENLRFYDGEKKNSPEFIKVLANLAHVYVNDAFAVCHRDEASVVGIAKVLPSYGGLLLKKEISMIDKLLENQKRPLVSVLGGAKVSSKIGLIKKLLELSDFLLIGGGMANTFFKAMNLEIGKSFFEESEVLTAVEILKSENAKKLILPSDVVIADNQNLDGLSQTVLINKVPIDKAILDIGPETEAQFALHLIDAKTIIWNGPLGYVEHPEFRRGTDFLYYVIAENRGCVSIVGGGDTISAISKKEYLENITHISTGGGAMLEYIEKGTLPGIEALKKKD